MVHGILRGRVEVDDVYAVEADFQQAGNGAEAIVPTYRDICLPGGIGESLRDAAWRKGAQEDLVISVFRSNSNKISRNP